MRLRPNQTRAPLPDPRNQTPLAKPVPTRRAGDEPAAAQDDKVTSAARTSLDGAIVDFPLHLRRRAEETEAVLVGGAGFGGVRGTVAGGAGGEGAEVAGEDAAGGGGVVGLGEEAVGVAIVEGVA